MTKYELKERFKKYAINVAFFVLKLPYNIVNKNYSDQLNRSASGAAANYSAALRAKSAPDFLNKLKIVEEELDESVFFFELIEAVNPKEGLKIKELRKEGTELLAIIIKSITTLRSKQIVNRN
ncbi:MAG: four helix bundle protein [Flavisolibacter sp.]